MTWIGVYIDHNESDEDPQSAVFEAVPGAKFDFSDLYEAGGTIMVFDTETEANEWVEDQESWAPSSMDDYDDEYDDEDPL